MKNKVLFLFEQYCDANPTVGLSNNFHNLVGSYKRYDPDAVIQCVHFDTLYMHQQIHVDFILEKAAHDFKPDLIVISFLGSSHMNPSPAILRKLRGNGYKICIMWPDGGYPWVKHKLDQLDGAYNLNVFWGGEKNPAFPGIWLWAPQDTSLYFPDIQERKVGFVGSLRGYQDRSEYLRYAASKGILMDIKGGQREGKLSAHEYAREIRSHKINLNFPESPSGKDQIKGRVFEITASRTLLLERDNAVTPKYFVPYEEYIPFESPEDLCGKIEYYLKNEEVRLTIAGNGYRRFIKDYSPKVFWSRVHYEIYAQHTENITYTSFDPFPLPTTLL